MKYLFSQHAPLPPNILLLQPLPHPPHLLPHSPAASVIRFLICKDADVHVISANGSTPHHLLLANPAEVSDECLECVKILIKYGCNPCLPNAFGEKPFDIAAKNGHLPVVEYLFSLDLLPSPSVLLSVSGSKLWNATLMIESLINKGVSVHVTCPNGDTVLHLSMRARLEEECLQRVKIFVKAGCDTRVCNAAGKTPFHIAAKKWYISVMEYLVSVGAPVPSDVMLAVFENNIRFNLRIQCCPSIRFLLEKGGDFYRDIVTQNGDSLLHLAAVLYPEHDALEVVKLLIGAGCSPCVLNSAHKTPIHTAAEYGNTSVINHFLSLDIPLPPDILLAAGASGARRFTKAKLIRFLIDKGADTSAVTTNGDTPLHLILNDGDEADRLESVKILIDAGCDPRTQNLVGKTPLHVAATHGFISVLEYLLSQDIPLPRDIFLASTRTIRFLLEREVDVRKVAINYGDVVELMGHTVVHDEDLLERARFLVGLGWDLSARNSAGETAIHVVARRGEIPALKYLLSQNIPLPTDILLAAVPSNDHQCRAGTVPLVQLLILEGANINPTAPNGDSPLHLALRAGARPPDTYLGYSNHHNDLCRLIEILLNYGSDPYARNADGQTPFDLAEAKGHFFKENFLRLVRNSRVQNLDS